MANEYDEQSSFEEDIEAILTTDSVQGDPPGFSGTLTGKINVVLFHIVNRTRWLKNTLEALNITVPNASTTVKGIAELATKAEAEAATDTTRIMTSKRTSDLLKHSNAQASETQRGTAEIANNSEAEGGTDDTRMMTSEKTQRYVRSSNAQATTSRRGTAELTTKTEAESGTDNTRIMTSQRTKEYLRHSNAQATETERGTVKKGTQEQVNAGTDPDVYITPATLHEFSGANPYPNSKFTITTTGSFLQGSISENTLKLSGGFLYGTLTLSFLKRSTAVGSISANFQDNFSNLLILEYTSTLAYNNESVSSSGLTAAFTGNGGGHNTAIRTASFTILANII